MFQRISATLVFFSVAILLAGCGGPDLPDTFPVTGSVTYNGRPVVGYTISFTLIKGGRTATGKTDDEGKFTLSTFGDRDGALSGDHSVAIYFIPTGTPPDEMPEDAPPQEGQQPTVIIPEKYGTPQTSGLKLTVTENRKDNKFAIEVSD